jgi:hypothetical protein
VGLQIVDALRSGKTVAVHCRQGIGRSAMMVAAALIADGRDAGTAVNAIRQSRGLDVPETQAQRQWISDFSAWLSSVRAAQQPSVGPDRGLTGFSKRPHIYGWFTEGFGIPDLKDGESCWMRWHSDREPPSA